MMKARELAIGTCFNALNMCGPNHMYRRVENTSPSDSNVIAEDLNWGGMVSFQPGVQVEVRDIADLDPCTVTQK